jgi:GTPase SAR1 family protein
MLIIIGLAGSGKTTYFHKNLSDKYELYDDFISNFFDGEIIEKINENICLIDPRLCDIEIFKKYMIEIEKFIDKSQIKLLLFENNPEKCLINSQFRKNKNVSKMIEIYSKKYDLNNYQDYNYEILKVYE